MKTTNCFLFFFFLILIIPSVASAYSINNLDFGTIKEGEIVTKDLTVSLTTQDSDSYFKIEKGGDINSSLKIEPMEFELKTGERKTLKVTLITTGLNGIQEGWIIARGQEPLEEGQIGYTVSLKSNIKVDVINQSTNNTANKPINENNNYWWLILVIGAIGVISFVVIRRLYYNGYF